MCEMYENFPLLSFSGKCFVASQNLFDPQGFLKGKLTSKNRRKLKENCMKMKELL